MSRPLNKIQWLWNRFRCMPPKEWVYRFRGTVRDKIFDRFEFWFSPIVSASGHSIRSFSIPLISEDRVLGRTYQVFSTTIPDYKTISNWRKDYNSGVVSPLVFAGDLDTLNYAISGDPKQIREVNRFHHFPYWGMEADSNLEEWLLILGQVREWKKQNPYLAGINWKSGIEVALRSVNWLLTLQVARERCPSIASTLAEEMLPVLFLNGKFLRSHLSLYSSANNHLLAELVGLLWISGSLECSSAKKWRDFALQMWEKEIQSQVSLDGFTREQALGYHFFVLELVLAGTAMIEAFSGKPHELGRRILSRMYSFMDVLSASGKVWPIIGDNDLGFVVRHPSRASRFDLEKVKLDLGRVLNSFEFLDHAKGSTHCYIDAGYYIHHGSRLFVVFDIGNLGYPSIAAHGHADALQVLLSLDGAPLLVDSGGYGYHCPKEWRDYFRGSSAHNTIVFNGCDQSVSGGRMMWTEHAKVVEFHQEGSLDVAASHTGYLKRFGLTHSRRIIINESANQFSILDRLEGGKGAFSIYFHFAPDLTVQEHGSILVIRRDGKPIANLVYPEGMRCSLHYGKEEGGIQGWYSSAYEQKEPAVVAEIVGEHDRITDVACRFIAL